MDHTLLSSPLLRWDGLRLVLNLKLVERYVVRALSGLDWLEDLELIGAGDAIRVRARIVWKGVRIRAAVDLSEIRLHHRRLGSRLRRSRVPGWLPMPRWAIEAAIASVDSEILTMIPGHGILVVDLRRWIPQEVVLSVRTVQATESYLHIWLGPGAVDDLPGEQLLRLAP